MVVVIMAFFGAMASLFAVLLWASVDAVLGSHSLTGDRALGIIGIGVVLGQVFWVVVIGWEEIMPGRRR